MNQGKSDEIERIFERIDTALAVRTEHANTARERRVRCFTDRASVAMALGKPLNTTATQVTSARRRLMFLVHEDKRGNLTRYAAWMAELVFSAANKAGLMVAAWDDPAARPPFVKVLDWPCPDTGRAGPSNAPSPNSTTAYERRTAHLHWARGQLTELKQAQQARDKTQRPADDVITDWIMYINEEEAALARMQPNARRPRGPQAAGGAAQAAADAANNARQQQQQQQHTNSPFNNAKFHIKFWGF